MPAIVSTCSLDTSTGCLLTHTDREHYFLQEFANEPDTLLPSAVKRTGAVDQQFRSGSDHELLKTMFANLVC